MATGSMRDIGGAALALAAGIAMQVAPAVAWDPQTAWLSGAGYAEPGTRVHTVDRAFMREWEANPPKGFATLAPENIAATRAAIQRHTAVVERGGWPMVPEVQMRAGMSDPAISVLRERLIASGDLKEEGSGGKVFDFSVEKAVKRYQASNGLTPTGIVDKRTIAALNVPAAARLKQLKANLSRLQELTASAAKRYVVVNIPAAQIEAVEAGKVVQRHAGVVGKPDRPTPLLRSAIHQMNFNPVWTLPPTVIDKDLLPKGRDMQARDQSVLVKYGIDAYDASGRKLDPAKVNFASATARNLVFRQQPGKENPLGFLKINFENAHSVYMHDTPSDSLFGRNFRAASSGCIRVQGIESLAAWLLADNGIDQDQILEMKRTGERKDVSLKRPVPLYFVYVTAWATEDGVVQFRRDLYNKDGIGPIAAAY